jgi:transcriptional regulator with XRE-family HTH domain
MQATDILVTRPLEYYRQERVLTVAQFAKLLGITEQTYRRLLREPEKVRMETRRQVLEALGLSSPHYVRELAPSPSPEMVTDVLAAYAEANREGWIACDPETLEPTGEVFDGEGKLVHTHDSKAS